MKTHYFLREDLAALSESITDLTGRVKVILKDAGESCREGAETFHDNFGHEDGMRTSEMWTKRRSELIALKASAQVIDPGPCEGRVAVGRIVTVVDENGVDSRFKIGSFMVLAQSEVPAYSYAAPMVSILINARVGDVRTGLVGNQRKTFTVVNVE